MAEPKEKYVTTPPIICIELEDDSSMDPHFASEDAPTALSVESDLSQSTTSTHEYPDGGMKAKLTVLGAFLALFFTFGQMNAFGTFQAWYASHQLKHVPASTISWIGSLQLWVFFFSVSANQSVILFFTY